MRNITVTWRTKDFAAHLHECAPGRLPSVHEHHTLRLRAKADAQWMQW